MCEGLQWQSSKTLGYALPYNKFYVEYLQVSRALSEEIRRLYELVEDFDRPFHADPMFVDIYKQELHNHVENGLGKKIQARCSSALNELVQITEDKMTGKEKSS